MIRVAEHFREHQRLAATKIAQAARRKWFIAARQEREKKELLEEQAENDMLNYAASAILATEIEVQQFEARLDTYDEATVTALLENTQALEAIEARILQNLRQAYIMEDGTRVFKSEDGSWGIDENGQRFDGRTHDMDAIPQTQVTAEQAEADFRERDLLRRERTQILKFQEKVDAARERVDKGDITKEELDDLDAELADAMPPSVKVHMPGFDTASNAPAAKTEFTATATPLVKPDIAAPTNDPRPQL